MLLENKQNNLLEKLCNASGPTGYEGDVRKIIKQELKKIVDEVKTDNMGNIIAHKKGKGIKVLIDAHMDEVAFIITGYNEDGTLNFQALGGINSKILPAKTVYLGEGRIPGVIGVKPIHLLSEEEKSKNFTYKDYCIDIGANSKEEVRNIVELGEYAVFTTEFEFFGEDLIKGKAFDDRMGCAVLLEVLKEKFDCDLYASFSVQEEIGERGALVSAFHIQPDIGIAIEGTICADMPNIQNNIKATEIGKGPAVSIMDRTSVFDKELIDKLIKTAKSSNIPYQFRRAVAGGNDAGAIIAAGSGAKVITISVPCRYIHSSVSVASCKDFINTCALLTKYLKSL